MKTLIFSAIFEGLRTRKDKTVAITLGTQEMSPDGYANLLGYLQCYIFVLMKEGEREVNAADIDELKSKEFDEFDKRQDKTPSQRLRNVFYILYEQDKEGFAEFKDYYDHKMENLISHFKEKIDQ